MIDAPAKRRAKTVTSETADFSGNCCWKTMKAKKMINSAETRVTPDRDALVRVAAKITA